MSSKKRKNPQDKNAIQIPYIPTEKKIKLEKYDSESMDEEDYDDSNNSSD